MDKILSWMGGAVFGDLSMNFLDKTEISERLTTTLPGKYPSGIVEAPVESEIYFESLSMSGLEEMHRYSIDTRLYEYFEFEPFTSLDQTRSYIKKLLVRMSVQNGLSHTAYWYVRRRCDGYLIGSACLVNLNYNRYSVEWGFGVDPSLWGEGYIFQIQEILKQYVFEVLRLNRLYGVSMATNARTISSVCASGMQHEGTLRDYYFNGSEFIDGWHYSMLRAEYLESLKTRHEATDKHNLKEIMEIVSSVLNEPVDAHTSMHRSAKWDSLNHMTIMVELTNRLGVKLTPLQIARAISVQAIHGILSSR
jgi:[ribosomal protein S5]-alanine N-acetyltransferase